MFQLCKIAVCGVALLSGAGCAGLKQFTASFEKQWSNPNLFEETLNDGAAERTGMNAKSLAMLEAGIIENNDCGSVRTNAKRAILLLPDSEWPKIVLAECDLAAGKAKQALTSFDEVIKLSAEPRVLLGKGIANIHLGRYERAMPPIYEALDKDTTLWRGWNALGVAYDMSGQRKEAEQAFLTAAELNQESGAPLNNLGISYMQQEDIAGAIRAFHGALKRQPELAPAQLNLRIAYAMNGEYDKAIVGASIKERAAVLNNAGVAATRRGEHDQARNLFQKALDTNPVFYVVAHDNLERLPR